MFPFFRVALSFLLLWYGHSQAQQTDWTADEQANYQTMIGLRSHFNGYHYDTTERGLVFNRYVYFDNVLHDTSIARERSRVEKFDAMFARMVQAADSIGWENLDARPTREFQRAFTYFKSFTSNEGMRTAIPFCLTFYDKRKPESPLGSLLFEPNTHKLRSWVVLCEAEYCYFLTFEML